jgi:hypothetical protein
LKKELRDPLLPILYGFLSGIAVALVLVLVETAK